MTADRVIYKVFSGTEPTGWDRRESMIDAQDCSTNVQLVQRGAEALAELEPEEVMEVTYLQTANSTFIFDVGDIITAEFPGAGDGGADITMVSRIVSMTYSYDETGEHITIGLGKKYPDLIKLLVSMNNRMSATVRR